MSRNVCESRRDARRARFSAGVSFSSRFLFILFSQRSGAIWPVSPSRESAARSEPVRPGQGNRALTGPHFPLKTAFVILDEVIRMTNRRVNALEHVVIPRLENTISYINSECVVHAGQSSLLKPDHGSGKLSP